MKNIKTKKNLGIEILRMILAFWVLIFHCYNSSIRIQKIISKRLFHVPTFMFLSFYYFYPLLSSRNISKMINRYERLFIPYIIWPLILFIFNYLISFFGFNLFEKNLLLKDFYIQLLIGSKYYGIFWFNFNLIFITFLFTIIYFISKKNFFLILQIIAFLVIYFRFSEIYIFDQNKKNYINLNLGTIGEMVPIAVTSISFSSINLTTKLKYYKKRILFFSTIIIYILFKYDIFIKYEGFRYPEILLNNFAAIFLFIFFSLIPLEKLTNKNQLYFFFINNITKFTGGIYYLHLIFFNFLKKSELIKNFSFFECIIIYFLCYFICLFSKNCSIFYLSKKKKQKK